MSGIAHQQVCRKGKLLELDGYVAASCPQKCGADVANLVPGVNSWVIDTGSGHHLVGRKGFTETEKAAVVNAGSNLTLATAGGTIKANQETVAAVRLFQGDVVARVLEDSPRVLSVNRLVTEHGAEFHWDSGGAYLIIGGKRIDLPVKSGVPLLAMPVVEE